MPTPPPALRTVTARPISAPPAVWSSFVRQGAWKTWVLVGQFFVIALLLGLLFALARREPDVVVVQPDGKSVYVNRSVAGAELVRFLAEQKQQPSDLTVTRFAKDFLELATSMNSTTVEVAWPRALALTAQPLRDRLDETAKKQALVESFKLAKIRSELQFDSLELIATTPGLMQLRAVVTRSKFSLLDPARAPERDRFVHDIVMRVITRTSAQPDGLEVIDWRAAPADRATTQKG
jgi:hypothetical protein